MTVRSPDTIVRAPDPIVRRPDSIVRSPDSADLLEAGLAVARRSRGWSFVALPAPVAAVSSIVDAYPSAPLVTWTSPALTLAGIGIAVELRGHGDARWHELVAAAGRIEVGALVGEAARPRLLGGASFAPGAADRAPWTGFGDAWFVLPRWTYIHDADGARLLLAVDAREARLGARWHGELAALRNALSTRFAPRPQPSTITIDRGDTTVWRATVRAITDAIARGECAKIVAARNAIVTLAGVPRAADLLAELDARHADCVRLLVSPAGRETLIAATPERLVRVDGVAVACDALAGSRARAAASSSDADHAALIASSKDRREHDLVVAAIASTLAGLGAELAIPDEPHVRALRHVLHLHTPIAATLRSPRHILELAAALHPTPAVGGTPTRFATGWIAAREHEPRGWYAAPVGWFDLEGNGELAVALRCGVLDGNRAHLWAGAGIVAGSDPDRELAETELKLHAMLGALGSAA